MCPSWYLNPGSGDRQEAVGGSALDHSAMRLSPPSRFLQFMGGSGLMVRVWVRRRALLFPPALMAGWSRFYNLA